MSEAIEALLACENSKAFAKLFKEQQKEFKDPLSFAAPLARYLCRRVYQRYYDDNAPHTFFGLAAAVNALPGFPEDRKWWPIVQQTWHAANSRRRNPWAGNGDETSPDAGRDDLFKAYCKATDSGDFGSAWNSSRHLLSSPEQRDWFRTHSLKRCLEDTFEDGIKLLFLDQCWRLAESLGWGDAEGILFPALHLVTLAPQETELGRIARRHAPGNHVLAQTKKLADDEYSSLEREFLFAPSLEEGLQVLGSLTQKGIGWEGCWDFIQLAAAQMVGNSKPGRWSSAVRAFLFAHTARKLTHSLDESALPRVLARAAGVVARASLGSREGDENRDLESLARSLCPTDTFATLRTLVSHSDPFASANAVSAILGMDESKHSELFESLATLAAKNDGWKGNGYDLLLVQAAVECYQSSTSEHRRKFLMNTAFLLGRMPKSYQLFGAYGVK